MALGERLDLARDVFSEALPLEPLTPSYHPRDANPKTKAAIFWALRRALYRTRTVDPTYHSVRRQDAPENAGLPRRELADGD